MRTVNFRRGPPQPRVRINHHIRVPEVKVLGSDGAQLGVMATNEALKLAEQQGLDLVEVGASVVPPIVKIMDYGRYVYEKERKEKNSKTGKKTPAQEIKTVKLGFRTGAHDLAVKSGQIEKFIKKGYKVRLEMKLRGRERGLKDLATEKLQKFMADLPMPYITESDIKILPNALNAIIRPGK